MKKIAEAIFILVLAGILLSRVQKTDAETIPPEQRINAEPFRVECTAYCDDGITASGKPTIEGLTIAGAAEWMGCAAVLYEVDPDGGIGDIIGIYQFTDTGYGRDGDIPRGETIDLYMQKPDACREWGRKDVYLQIVDGKG